MVQIHVQSKSWAIALHLAVSMVPASAAAEGIIWGDRLVPKSSTPFCNAGLQRPLEAFRAAFFARPRSLACTQAASEICKINPNDVVIGAKHGDQSSVGYARHYASKCLRSFASLADKGGKVANDPDRHDHLLSAAADAEVERIERSVGVFYDTLSKENFCSGALVALENGATGIMTAAHCLGNSIEDGPMFKIAQARRNVVFKTLAGAEWAVDLGQGVEGHVYDEKTSDVAFVPVLGQSPDQVVQLQILELQPWEPLYIMGYSPFLEFGFGARRLKDMIAVSVEPSCFLMVREAGGTIHYNCQTVNGQSGSPIFVIRGNAFRLAGVHVNTSFNCDISQLKACAEGAARAGNFGIAVQPPE